MAVFVQREAAIFYHVTKVGTGRTCPLMSDLKSCGSRKCDKVVLATTDNGNLSC